MSSFHRLHLRIHTASKPRHGLTLVEMLVAAACTLLLMASLVQGFGMFANSTQAWRSTVEMSGQLRSVENRLQEDLAGITSACQPWTSVAKGDGYFEYIEGRGGDTHQESASYLGDVNDILSFTTRSRGEPFVGTINGVQMESQLAEVVWWYADQKLHRRLLLIRPDVTGVSLSATYLRDNDISVGYAPDGTTPIANTLGALAIRKNRYGRQSSTFPHILKHADLTTIAASPAKTLMLSNTVAFDIRAYDPTAEVRSAHGEFGPQEVSEAEQQAYNQELDYYQKDEQYRFRMPDAGHYHPNARGANEKYFQATGGVLGWFYILPDGKLYEYTDSTYTNLTGNLVATLPTEAHTTPSLLHEAFENGQPAPPTPPISSVDLPTSLTPADLRWTNGDTILGKGAYVDLGYGAPESDYPAPNSDPTSDPAYPIYLQQLDYYQKDQQYGLRAPDAGHYYTNHRGGNEKYFQSTGGVTGWYYMLPNGDLYDYTDSSFSSLAGNMVASFPTEAYTTPALLHDAFPGDGEPQPPPPQTGGSVLVFTPSLFSYQGFWPLTNVNNPPFTYAGGYTESFFDTWPLDYENDGIDQGGDGIIDLATNGLDDDGRNGVDDPGERETRPPFPYRLPGIHVVIRIVELDSKQLRQTSLSVEFDGR